MNNNAWFKKEKPLLSMQTMGGGATGTLFQGASSKPYIDDVFSSYVYKGNGTTTGDTQVINNGIDLAGEGGMVWTKSRDSASYWHTVVDTARGTNKTLYPNSTYQAETLTNVLNSFNDNGFTAAYNSSYSGVFTNKNDDHVASWTFRKAPGFFDVVTYTGTGSNQNITHDLGCEPGFIITKKINSADSWYSWHRGLTVTNYLKYINFNDNAGENAAYAAWAETAPTATHFTVGSSDATNYNGDNFVAYLFAGGESTAATAVSVKFDGSGDYLSIPDSSDFDLGSGDFTIECWAKVGTSNGSNQECFINQWVSGQYAFFFGSVNEYLHFYWSTNGSNSSNHDSGYKVTRDGQWHHYAVTRNGNDLKLFVDGTQKGSTASMSGVTINNSTTTVVLGDNPDVGDGSRQFNGNLSNVRVVKGTAVYTTSFRPPTEPLTNITNTKLLCCNNSSVTGSTVTPGTITANGDPLASIKSPFDDPEGFKFGEDENQGVVKTGSYIGNGGYAGDGPSVDLGWEPQWVIVKKCTGTPNDWLIFDSIRGIFNGGGGSESAQVLYSNTTAAESSQERLYLTSTGFEIRSNNDAVNGSGITYIYTAIRRPDGYVGKPAEAGTDVFAMDDSNASTTIPNWDSGFPVDFATTRRPESAEGWYTPSRLTGDKYVFLNDTAAQTNLSAWKWDNNVGWGVGPLNSYQAWMWKRHAGFDVVTYEGDGSLRNISHSMGIAPEMMWFKKRNGSKNWYVYHKGINGGSSPEDYSLRLNTNAAQDSDGNTLWNQTVPTATHFTINTDSGVNDDGDRYMAMLFSSVNGISKCGYYTGDGTSGRAFNIGFQPRFIVIRPVTIVENWYVLDTVRGWGVGGDPYMLIDTTNAQAPGYNFGAPTATGFTWADTALNVNGEDYIYYAHA